MEECSADCKIKHLEMIEAVIGRMGSNSFKLKGWAVTLISIAGMFSARGDDKRCFLLAFVPLLSFWLLDAYYLQTERKCRVLFKHVISRSEDSADFDMDVRHIACKYFVMKSFFVLLEKSAKFPSSFIKQFFDISYAVANAALVISGIQPSFWSCLR